MPLQRKSMGRYDTSVEGWSAVDKVAQFSHAVGRVSGGRGSAILIAVMDSQGQLIDSAVEGHTSRVGTSGRGSNANNYNAGSAPPNAPSWSSASPSDGATGAPPRFQPRTGHDSFRSGAAGSFNSFEQNGRHTTNSNGDDGDTRRGRDVRQPPLGVLLTTSHVLCIPEEAEEATVTFLDQLGMMTAAVLGHDPRPMRVPLRGAYGFVTSSAESNEHSAKYRRGTARRRRSSSGSNSSAEENNVTRGGGSHKPSNSYQDEPDYLLYRYQDGSDEDSAEDVGFTLTFCDIFPEPPEATASAVSSRPTSPLHRRRASGSEAGGSRRASPLRFSASGREPRSTPPGSASHVGETTPVAARRRSGSPSDVGTAPTSASRSGGAAGASSAPNLLLVQPLPVPLLLSTIPDIRVGDAHLMITHVNNGRRCYRVQHVSAVHPDYCEYKLASASEDECSGGPVFNSAGDFIGIQHERRGYSICLLMRSIVRNLFESDLLGMCRSPISEVSVKKREPQTRLGDLQQQRLSGGFSPRASFKRSTVPSRLASMPETAATTPRTSAAAAITSGSPVAVSPAAPASAAPSTSKPLSQQVPGYEAVFKEFYAGFDSVSHILYAFPYSRQLLKLALENLSQLNYGNELDQMSAIGGVGAILETIDGYPQDEAIVSGALSAMCRICIYERNLTMFLHLDGVATTMEVMKEYVHQPTVLQWGTHLLTSATDASQPSAARCAEAIVRSRGPQLLVNVLRVHGAVQRKSAVRHLQHNRLVRWTCDLMANLLAPDPKRTTLFLREDLLALLLQLLHDYTGNLFLVEGLVHVFCVLVCCFADLDGECNPHAPEGHRVHQMVSVPEPPRLAPPGYPASFVSPTDRPLGTAFGSGGVLGAARTAPPALHTAVLDSHRISFFFLCQVVMADTDSCFFRSLLDISEAAMDPKSSLTAHRGRPEVVLLRCFETLRLLLSWKLLVLHRRRRAPPAAAAVAPCSEDSLSSLPLARTASIPTSSSSLQMSTPTDELLRLRVIVSTIREYMPSCYELQAQLSAVEQLVRQQE